MYKEIRWQKIEDILNNNGLVQVNRLAEELGVSTMTVRRDLEALSKKGTIERTHGGAVLLSKSNLLVNPVFLRVSERAAEKQEIARTVAKMIRPGEKIYLAAGSTTYWVAKAIAARNNLTVVTNSLPVANLLAASTEIEVIVVGGFLRQHEYSLVGSFAESMVGDLHLDKVIMGVGGIHPDAGLTNMYPQEMMMDRAYLNISDHIIVVADHTKIGKVATSRTANLDAVRTIVTSRLAPADMIDRIRQKGVEVILA